MHAHLYGEVISTAIYTYFIYQTNFYKMQIPNFRILLVGFLCLALMTSCTKEDLSKEINNFTTADTQKPTGLAPITYGSKGAGGDNENDNNPDVIVTINDENDTAIVDHLIVMTHNNNGNNGNGNGNSGNGNGNGNGNSGNGNNGNGNPVYSAYTTETGIAILHHLESGNYTIDVYDEEDNLVYTASKTIMEEREVIQIVL